MTREVMEEEHVGSGFIGHSGYRSFVRSVGRGYVDSVAARKFCGCAVAYSAASRCCVARLSPLSRRVEIRCRREESYKRSRQDDWRWRLDGIERSTRFAPAVLEEVVFDVTRQPFREADNL